MKNNLVLCNALVALCCHFAADSASAQLVLIAPGQTTPLFADRMIFAGSDKDTVAEFEFTQNLGTPWRFIFTGIEAFADADGVTGYYAWSGQMRLYPQSSGSTATGTGRWSFKGSINGDEIGPISFSTDRLSYPGPYPQQMLWPTPKVYENVNITAKWWGMGNARDIDGYWEILGSVIPVEPDPVGSLIFESFTCPEGTAPQFKWFITRPGS